MNNSFILRKSSVGPEIGSSEYMDTAGVDTAGVGENTTVIIALDTFGEPLETTSTTPDTSNAIMDNIMETFENFRGWRGKNTCLTVFGFVTLLLVILLPMSFSGMEYYEMGFTRNRLTGTVDTSKVYKMGLHFIGPGNVFKKFRSDAHYVSYKNIKIFNKEKLEVEFSCSLLYQIRPEQLKLLHDTYDINYEPIIQSTALSTLKNAAAKYSVNEYRMERTKVKLGLAKTIAQAIGGMCCRESCSICPDGCKSFSKCTEKEMGLYVDLTHFHLHMVGITKAQGARFLQQVVEQERKDTELYTQDEKIKRKETEQMRHDIVNQANEVAQNATAESNLIAATSTIESKRITSDASNKGLQIIYSKLNITEYAHKKTLDYVRTLANSKANMYVGFNYMVAKP